MNHRQMRLVIGILKIQIQRHHLVGAQHPFVNDNSRRERADVIQLGFWMIHRAELQARLLADHEQLAIERRSVHPLGRGNKDLLDDRHAGTGRGTNISGLDIGWNRTPAKQRQTLLCNESFDGFFAEGAMRFVAWQEDISCTVLTQVRKLHTQFGGNCLLKELVRNGG